MKRRIKSIQAFETPIGLGMAYMDVAPTFHPPSLAEEPAPKMNKLLKRLLKQQAEELLRFRQKNLTKQPKVTMPLVTHSFYDPSPLNLPPLFTASADTSTRRKRKH
jgi:hypothetical protein